VRGYLALQGGNASCHLGIAVGPTDGETAQELVIAAGHALDRARLRETSADIAFFSNTQDARLLYLRQMEADLVKALSSQQFALGFQPIVHLDTTRIAGFEARLHWAHPERGRLEPAEFMEAAEASGMTVRLSEWVVAQALATLAAFDRLGGAPVRMFIKIADKHFQQDGFVEALREQMLLQGIQAGRLELQVSERTVIDLSPGTLQVLHALRQIGVATAIDDFGRGHSNLLKLTELPVDTLKIDRSFTHASTQSSAAASVSSLISELARTLGLQVLVDGIASAGQLRHFQALGCRHGQGDFLSPALPSAEAGRMLQAGKPLFLAATAESAAHLLLLDDEENILRALRRVLRHEGYQVHLANTPSAAFELLAAYPMGVVLSDQRMPQMSGTDFLRKVKRLYPNTIRMVLSGYSELHTVQSAVNEGAIWKFLSKPWDDGELRQQIRDAFHEYAVLRAAQRTRTQLESQVSQRDRQLALEAHALESSRNILSMLPIAVLGVDPSQMVVMSNLQADRLLGGGDSLMGSLLSESLPFDCSQALSAPGPVDLDVGGGHFRLHVQVMGSHALPSGYLLSLVPR
jgi:EAL domain-containing protein (putative c-di-GMP-specific phosphodiesterase class I)/FixJ family two-component response regulator